MAKASKTGAAQPARKRRPPARRQTARALIQERNCSVGRTIDIIGDGWTFMVLRECYFGSRRFEQFKQLLGLPRTTLAARLRRLTGMGILHQVPYTDSRPPRLEYRLTPAGVDLYAVMLALMTFGDKWLARKGGKPLQLIHVRCGKHCSASVVCSECSREIVPRQVGYRDGPGAGQSPVGKRVATRRSADPVALEGQRPSSVARALQLIGDRWSFMILREAFMRVRRFDELQTRLGIAPNILADRLARLLASGVFRRVQYRTGPDRYEYRFTDMGKDLYSPMIAMLRWGDTWLADGKPPLLLTHLECGKDFHPVVACSQCLGALHAHEMRYLLNYRDPKRVSQP